MKNLKTLTNFIGNQQLVIIGRGMSGEEKEYFFDVAEKLAKTFNEMSKFTQGQELSQRSIGDHNCIFRGVVVKRTAKFVTVKVEGYRDVRRCKVNLDDDGNEMIYPLGRYSMAPRFKA